MTGIRHERAVAEPVYLLWWHYIGGETITLDGATAQQVNTLPADANIVEIRARAGEVYFEINGVTASALSGGYIPEDGAELIGPLDNLLSLWVFSGTAGAVAHLLYFKSDV